MKLAYLNLVGLLLVITVNALANGLPINGLTTGEISAMYPNLFVPAGITFSIWGLIYLSLVGFCIYPFVAKDFDVLERIGVLFFVTCLLNVSWIIAWHHLYVFLSLALMLCFLFCLILIYVRCRKSPPQRKREKWLVYKPFSIYLAWICVATIANTTAYLVSLDFTPPSPMYWAVAMILATQLLVWIVNIKYHDIAYSLVIIWALLGIVVKQSDTGFDAIVYTCVASIFFTTLNAFYYRYRSAIS
ncbi:hypothetical protein E1176_02225 [Fulvivirga sp. RKSG066]|uniref:tryptophan-rich sensory protein n=1 Tax=Fulvivirga aurantia TaxID=2529383 RepID=UPI0012BC13CA|nr:tryptophan-rich sensory protein [Fulvivirga aurantia]MTI19830.1 hypothetical protein [Fulvivirga aurantia]